MLARRVVASANRRVFTRAVASAPSQQERLTPVWLDMEKHTVNELDPSRWSFATFVSKYSSNLPSSWITKHWNLKLKKGWLSRRQRIPVTSNLTSQCCSASNIPTICKSLRFSNLYLNQYGVANFTIANKCELNFEQKKHETQRMVADWHREEGWGAPAIVPFHNLELHPACITFNFPVTSFVMLHVTYWHVPIVIKCFGNR